MYGEVAEAGPVSVHGYSVDGSYGTAEGRRFNPKKLFLDPFAKQIVGSFRWSDALVGYTLGHRREDLSIDRRDSAGGMPKRKVIDPAFTWRGDRSPDVPWHALVTYDLHAKGFTVQHPGVPTQPPGPYGGRPTPPAPHYHNRRR